MNNKLTRLLLVSGLVIGSTTALITNQKVFGNAVQTKQAQPNNANIFEDDDFRFKLNSCSRRGKIVSCNLLVTNLDKDRRVGISSGSWNNPTAPRIIDSEGNEYLPEKVDLGSKTINRGNIIYIKLIQGIPIKAAFYYDIPQNISKLAILEVNYISNGFGKAEFRDISITKSASTPQRKK